VKHFVPLSTIHCKHTVNTHKQHLSQNSAARRHSSEDSPSSPAFSPNTSNWQQLQYHGNQCHNLCTNLLWYVIYPACYPQFLKISCTMSIIETRCNRRSDETPHRTPNPQNDHTRPPKKL